MTSEKTITKDKSGTDGRDDTYNSDQVSRFIKENRETLGAGHVSARIKLTGPFNSTKWMNVGLGDLYKIVEILS